MKMTRERISFNCDPTDMLLSLKMGFSFVRAAIACIILEGISGLEPLSETTVMIDSISLTIFMKFSFYTLLFSPMYSSVPLVCAFCQILPRVPLSARTLQQLQNSAQDPSEMAESCREKKTTVQLQWLEH